MIALLLACGIPTASTLPTAPTSPPTEPEDRPCGASFSADCTTPGEDRICVDNGPLTELVPSADLTSLLEAHRRYAESVRRGTAELHECYPYIARPCEEPGTLVVAIHHSEPSSEVYRDGAFVGFVLWGALIEDNYGIEIDPVCGTIYNGPADLQDCAIEAFSEALRQRPPCNVALPCDMDTCVIDELP